MKKENRGIGASQQLVVVAIIVAVIGVGVFFIIEEYPRQSEEGQKNFLIFKNEKYDFSVSYPSNWTMDNMEYTGRAYVMLNENTTEGNSNARVQIIAGRLDYPSLDNLKNTISNQIENNENLESGGIKEIDVDGANAIDIAYEQTTSNGIGQGRMIFFKRDNLDYAISAYVDENHYEQFKTDIESIVDKFSFISE
ncbi:hypothetical protein AKJ49_02305 [candidate division MSBL1 archaeon SCGC-AAA382A03]|uniref:PsbP C-terminal domain-containing protein n=1 Tax=candidate division MSBL1 archaeon SCGC-AAA382A03 TaxID=1698278 RepID=A0A133VCQ0_9EURY|nr:hypothetical protein AKJ49_02305 [candidate division MSBL1 archaeon SCGC-AAA382A03]